MTALTAMLLFGACEKKHDQTDEAHFSPNRIVNMPSEGKTAPTVLMLVRIGHDARNCNGCVMHDGHLVHIDCMGQGHYCAISSSVILDQIGTDITATTTDTFGLTSEDFFLMPDRSLNYTDENNNRLFLNIPEQLVYRDNSTQQFTFTGLFFSSTAAYSNN